MNKETNSRKRLHEQIAQDQQAQPSGKTMKERGCTKDDKVNFDKLFLLYDFSKLENLQDL